MSIDYSKAPGAYVTIHPQPQPAGGEAQNTATKQEASKNDFWGEDGFGFDDVLDLINPLQHIPVVSSIYRELTGDEIAPGPRMIGGAVVGGVTGFLASAANVIYEEATGSDIFESVVAMFDGDDADAATAQVAAKTEQPVEQRVAYRAPTPLIENHDIPRLEPLQFGAVNLPPTLPSAQDRELEQANAAPLHSLDGLLEYDVAMRNEQYRKAQMMTHVLDVAKDMKI